MGVAVVAVAAGAVVVEVATVVALGAVAIPHVGDEAPHPILQTGVLQGAGLDPDLARMTVAKQTKQTEKTG